MSNNSSFAKVNGPDLEIMVGGDQPSAAREKVAAIPPWLKDCLHILETKFPTARDMSPWDAHDSRDYGRQFAGLTGPLAKQAIQLLRERHTFRPSVAEVHTAVLEITGRISVQEPQPGYFRASLVSVDTLRANAERELAGNHLQLTSAEAGGRGRKKFKERAQWMRQNLTPQNGKRK